MPRDLPLIWLFVAATLILDAVLWAVPEKPYTSDGALTGLVLGQVAALGFWAAAGDWHRMARGGTLVGCVAGLAVFTARCTPLPMGAWLAVLATEAAVVWGASLLFGWMERFAVNDNAQIKGKLRLPLIEFFGWTIVAALVSLAARHMEFGEMLKRDLALPKAVCVLMVALAGAWVVLRGVRWPFFPLFTAVVVGYALTQFPKRPRSVFGTIIAAEAAYLAIAAIVCRLVLRSKPDPDAGPTEPVAGVIGPAEE